MSTTTSPAIAAALDSARIAGLKVTTDDRHMPTITGGHLALGFLTVGDEVDVVVLNRISGGRSVRHCGTDASKVAKAVATWIAGVTA